MTTNLIDSDPKTHVSRVQNNLRIMQIYFDVLFTKDLAPLLDLIDEHIEWLVVPTGDTFKGKEELAKGAQNHWAASPDRIKTLVNMFASEDYASLEYISSGTLTNRVDFPSIQIAPTGTKYALQCCFVFHITELGTIDRVREYFDMETVKRQLGIVSSAATGEHLARNP